LSRAWLQYLAGTSGIGAAHSVAADAPIVGRRKATKDYMQQGGANMKYRVHRFDIKMTSDQTKLEQYLNSIEGEIVAIIPNVTWAPKTQVDFLLVVEKLP
jgi:hypothetical protein